MIRAALGGNRAAVPVEEMVQKKMHVQCSLLRIPFVTSVNLRVFLVILLTFLFGPFSSIAF
jgi:hypothetical protein